MANSDEILQKLFQDPLFAGKVDGLGDAEGKSSWIVDESQTDKGKLYKLHSESAELDFEVRKGHSLLMWDADIPPNLQARQEESFDGFEEFVYDGLGKLMGIQGLGNDASYNIDSYRKGSTAMLFHAGWRKDYALGDKKGYRQFILDFCRNVYPIHSLRVDVAHQGSSGDYGLVVRYPQASDNSGRLGLLVHDRPLIKEPWNPRLLEWVLGTHASGAQIMQPDYAAQHVGKLLTSFARPQPNLQV